MVADQSRIYYSARTATLGGAQVASLSCRTDTAHYEGSAESDIDSAKDVFASVVDGEIDEFAEISLNGRHSTHRVTSPGHSIVLPRGSHLVTKRRGRVSSRYFLCEIEHDAFARLVDPDLSEFELRQYYGPTALDPSIVRRLSSACVQPDSPMAYIEALATIFIIDLYRAYSGRALPAPRNPHIGDAKFRLALDFIEENLHREIGLAELASLLGFSVAHFSHAFKAVFGVAPYHTSSCAVESRAQKSCSVIAMQRLLPSRRASGFPAKAVSPKSSRAASATHPPSTASRRGRSLQIAARTTYGTKRRVHRVPTSPCTGSSWVDALTTSRAGRPTARAFEAPILPADERAPPGSGTSGDPFALRRRARPPCGDRERMRDEARTFDCGGRARRYDHRSAANFPHLRRQHPKAREDSADRHFVVIHDERRVTG